MQKNTPKGETAGGDILEGCARMMVLGKNVVTGVVNVYCYVQYMIQAPYTAYEPRPKWGPMRALFSPYITLTFPRSSLVLC